MKKTPAWTASDGVTFFDRAACARREAELELRQWFKVREVMGPETLGDEAVKDAANLLAVLKRVVPPKAKGTAAPSEPSGEPAEPGAESTETRARGRRRGGLASGAAASFTARRPCSASLRVPRWPPAQSPRATPNRPSR